MAVDSTGWNDSKKVQCFICNENPIQFRTYTPKYGHSGEALNVGTCIEPHRFGDEDSILKEGQLFEIKPFDKSESQKLGLKHSNGSDYELPVWFKETQLHTSSQIYHYNGFVLPDFGDSMNHTFYVCKECLSANKENLHKALEKVYYDKVNERMGDFLWVLVRDVGLLDNCRSNRFRKRWRNLGKRDKNAIVAQFKNLMEDFRNANPVNVGNTLRKIKPLEKIIK